MANVIKLKRGSGSDPSASDLAIGELAIRTDTGKIFLKTDGGSVTSFSAGGLSDGDKGDLTVSNAGTTWLIDSGVIDNANINASAAIAGTKIAPDFGSQNIVTTGTLGSGDITISSSKPRIDLVDTGHNSDFYFINDDGTFAIKDSTNDAGRLVIASNGQTTIYGNCDFAAGIDVTGNITVTGTVDGIDIAALNAAHSSISTSNGSILDGVVAITQSAGDNSTKVATTAYTDTAISNLVDSSPGTLNTLNELAAALGDDANFSTTVTNSIATKLPLAGGTLTGDLGVGTDPGTEFHVKGSGTVARFEGTGGNCFIDLLDSDDSTRVFLGVDGGMFKLQTSANSWSDKFTVTGAGDATFAGDIKMEAVAGTANMLRIPGHDGSSATQGCEINHQSGNFQLNNAVGNAFFISAGILYLRSGGNNDALTLDGSQNATFAGAVTAKRLTLSDDGASSPIFMLKTDDNSPWGFTIKNDTYSTSADVGLKAYQNNDGAFNVRLQGNSEYNSFYLLQHNGSSERQILVFNTSGNATFSGSVTATGGFSGSGASLTNVNATTLDSIDSGSFLRSDAADTASGDITFSDSGQYPVVIGSASGMNDGRLLLRGSSNPYIRFREGNTDKAYIQWHSNGMMLLWNSEEDRGIKISGIPTFYDGTEYRLIWHASNDGAGSGLDADTLDGIQGSSFLRSDADDTTTGNLTISKADARLKLYSTDTSSPNYPGIDFDTANNQGATLECNIFDAELPTSGLGLVLKKSASNTESNTLTFNVLGDIYAGGTSLTGLSKVWHAGNDGSGSGLDADTLDGTQAAKFLSSYDRTTTTGWEDSNRNFRVNTGGTSAGLAFHKSDGGFVWQIYGDGTYYGFLNNNWGSWDIKKSLNGNMMLNNNNSNIVWHAGNDGSGSGLDADTVDGFATSQSGGTNKIAVTDSSGYLIIDDWIRVGNGQGIYASNGQHLYAGANDSAYSWILQSDHSTDTGIGMRTSQGTIRGYAYANSTMVGLLNGSGSWVFRVTNGNSSNGLQTGGGYLVWHQQNDGSGSGLDADTVDGLQASSFLRADASDSFSGELTSTNRSNGVFGTYDSYKTDHIWSMGTSYKNHSSGTNFGNLYGLAYKHTNNATGGTMGGSHQMVWCGNGDPKGAIGYHCVWHASAMKVGTSNHVVWHAGNDGSGSGLDADKWDGYQFSDYINQSVRTDSNPGFGNVTCSSVTTSSTISTSGWFYNQDSGEGLYNNSTAQHWYSDHANYYNLDGGGSAVGIRFRDTHASTIRGYIYGNNSNQIGFLDQSGYWRLYVNGSSNVVAANHFIPAAADSYDLGTTNNRWRNLYVQDMHFSNEGKTNSVDGTWGDWTLQEGEENIFMLNNRTGKKYRMALQEVT